MLYNQKSKPRYLKGYQKAKEYKKLKFIILLLAVLLLYGWIALLATNYLYSEKNKASYYYDCGFVFVFGGFTIFLIAHGLVSSYKRKELQPVSFLREVGYWVLILLIPYIILKPLFIGIILFVNSNVGAFEKVKVSGHVVYKRVWTGRGTYSELHIGDGVVVHELRTSPTEEKKYAVGNYFSKELSRGSLGILFKHKSED